MIKRIMARLLAKINLKIVRNNSREDFAFKAQEKLLNSTRKKIIFDVGAYDGEIALRYNQMFDQNCLIYSFEPFEESYQLLINNTKSRTNILTNKIALGDRDGIIDYYSNEFSATNSILPTSEKGKETWGIGTLETKEKIKIPVKTLDSFVKEHNIDQIDILKMDTQGSEYLVLEGAKESLMAGIIKMVYTEIIIMPTYEGQKELNEVLKMMRDYDFSLFNIYQSLNSKGQLRYLDALFVCNKNAELN